MKKLIEAFKKEEHTDYATLLFVAGAYMYSIYESALFNGLSFSSYSTFLFVGIFILAACVLGLLSYSALKHDVSLSEKKMDERELMHEYQVSHAGYQVLITLIGVYWVIFELYNPWFAGIIAITILSRLGYRWFLEENE